MNLLVLAICLVVAALLRLPGLDTMEYKKDSDFMVHMVSQVVDEGVFLTEGEASTKGPSNSPLSAYLISPVWAVSPNPLSLAVSLALLNVAAVGVTYLVGQRFFTPRAGLIAAACLAASPWAVMFSRRKIGREDMLIFFVTLLVFATLALVVEGRRRAVFWVLLLAGVVAQVHLTGPLAVGAAVLYLLVYRPRISRSALVGGLVAFGVLFLPYGLYLAGGGWRGYTALFSSSASRGAAGAIVHQVDWLWRLVNIGNFDHLIGETYYYLKAEMGAWSLALYPLAALERWTFLAGLGWLTWRMVSPGSEPNLRPAGLLILLLIAAPTTACLSAGWPCPPRYFLPMFPAQFLVIGIAIDSWLNHLHSSRGPSLLARTATGAVGLALAGLVLTQAHFSSTLISLIREKGGASGEYGVGYRHKLSLAEHLARNYGPGCFRLGHEWRPLYKLRMGREVDGLAGRESPERPCAEDSPERLFLIEAVDRPLSPEAEAALGSHQRFGPIILYTRDSKNGT